MPLNRYCILALVLHAIVPGAVAHIRVVTTGDSLTRGYSPGRIQTQFDEQTHRIDVSRVATNGNHAERYTGHDIDPSRGTFVDYPELVLAEDPDVIIFMLGTNDAFPSSTIQNGSHYTPTT